MFCEGNILFLRYDMTKLLKTAYLCLQSSRSKIALSGPQQRLHITAEQLLM